ncbi:hypothetical protein [Flavobacterium sp. 5]|uniref:hypothetical protein n=1 Tax=Flavobacterium sp. 5 TaxID=2035199 RepID=UPI000C2B911B|nr:hypothetical protein [Flavobacterium sp. 5]PKB15199.1 hypothetical protein CLU82_0263 [Flavobacterium sp. 5]
MNKKTKKWLIIISCLVSLIFAFFNLNKIIKIIDFTSINVQTENGIDAEKVKIYQSFYSINRKNDSELFENKHAKLVFEGNDNGKIKTEYGENCFLVIYENKYYFQFTQICTNDNDYKKYNLKLSKNKNNRILLNADIEPGMKFEREMNLISESKNLRCNGVINEDNGIFNGIELRKNSE